MRCASFILMKRYSVYVTPVCDGGSKLMVDVDLVRFAVVVDSGTTEISCSFDSWAKLRMELLSANVELIAAVPPSTTTAKRLRLAVRLTVGPSCEWNYSVPTFSAWPNCQTNS